MKKRIGGIEAGGTKMVCAVADVDDATYELIARISIPTTTPKETIPQMVDFFKKYEITALGIGCFGPLDLDENSKTYGYITKTPKLAWADFDIQGAFAHALGVPVRLDTDVNGAILGEVTYGAAKGCSSAIYITIGTGVGVGVYCNGALMHGLVHPEAGHILISRREDDSFEGGCPFHKNCLEGLASGPAIEKRWKKPAKELADCPTVWEMEADYIGQAIANYVLTYSPQKIILWGGVMHQKQLFTMVRNRVQELLGGYVHSPWITEQIEDYIIPPALGENPGILGAITLGRQALE